MTTAWIVMESPYRGGLAHPVCIMLQDAEPTPWQMARTAMRLPNPYRGFDDGGRIADYWTAERVPLVES